MNFACCCVGWPLNVDTICGVESLRALFRHLNDGNDSAVEIAFTVTTNSMANSCLYIIGACGLLRGLDGCTRRNESKAHCDTR